MCSVLQQMLYIFQVIRVPMPNVMPNLPSGQMSENTSKPITSVNYSFLFSLFLFAVFISGTVLAVIKGADIQQNVWPGINSSLAFFNVLFLKQIWSIDSLSVRC